MKARPPQFRSLRRSLIAVSAYLIGFAGVLVLVCWKYLLPALRAAASTNDPQQKRMLSATASLVLLVVLFVLLAGLLLAMRIGRFFFPRPTPPRAKPTQYVDAWEESARRVNVDELPEEGE